MAIWLDHEESLPIEVIECPPRPHVSHEANRLPRQFQITGADERSMAGPFCIVRAGSQIDVNSQLDPEI